MSPDAISTILYDAGHYVFLVLLAGIALRFLYDAVAS